jgi:hypothetical protein
LKKDVIQNSLNVIGKKKKRKKKRKMILSVRIWKTTTPKEKTYKKKTNEKMKEM